MHLEYDAEGNLHLRAVDFETSQAEIVLSSNGFQFTVTFPFRLPNKKAQWQELSSNTSGDVVMSVKS